MDTVIVGEADVVVETLTDGVGISTSVLLGDTVGVANDDSTAVIDADVLSVTVLVVDTEADTDVDADGVVDGVSDTVSEIVGVSDDVAVFVFEGVTAVLDGVAVVVGVAELVLDGLTGTDADGGPIDVADMLGDSETVGDGVVDTVGDADGVTVIEPLWLVEGEPDTDAEPDIVGEGGEEIELDALGVVDDDCELPADAD